MTGRSSVAVDLDDLAWARAAVRCVLKSGTAYSMVQFMHDAIVAQAAAIEQSYNGGLALSRDFERLAPGRPPA